jgi:hypothetical protein
MKEEIDAILQDLLNVHINQVGNLWQIRIGNHAGAREDGISLARDMLAMHQARERAMAEPVPVEIPEFLLEPEPEAVAEPMPMPPEPEPALRETVPDGLLDLVRENEPYGETQTRLWSLYLELNGKLMLGLATEEDGRLHTRLHGHLAWISKGAAEVVT